MKLKFDEVGVPTTLAQIEKFSRRYRIVLPREYVAFLLQANGGYPEDDFVFPTGEFDDSSVLSHFYGLYPQSDNIVDLRESFETMVLSGEISHEYLPIADDAFGLREDRDPRVGRRLSHPGLNLENQNSNQLGIFV